MECPQRKQRLDHRAQVGLPALGSNEVMPQPQVKQRAAGVDLLVQLGRGAHRRQRCGSVGADIGGHALAGRLARAAAIRGGAQHAAHWDVVGDAHKRRKERRAENILVLMDLFIEMVGDLAGDIIGIVVIVAVFRRSFGGFLQFLIALPIGLQGIGEGCHVADLVLEHQLFDSGQRVGNDSQPDAGDDRPDVILRTTMAQILARCKAVLYAAGQERARHHLSMQTLGLHRQDDRVAAQIIELTIECCFYFLIAGHLSSGLFIQPHLFAGHQADALVQRVFQRRAKVHVDGGGPLTCLTVMGHHAAAVVPVAGILGGIACI